MLGCTVQNNAPELYAHCRPAHGGVLRDPEKRKDWQAGSRGKKKQNRNNETRENERNLGRKKKQK